MITNTQRGTIAMVLAATSWGSFSLIFAQLKSMPPVDIVSYRVIFGLVSILIWLGIKGRLREPFAVLKNKRETLLIFIAALMIAMNWLGFVYAVTIGKALEASLGYFLFPLVTIAFGTLIKKQALRPAQWIAICLALISVAVLTYGLGHVPWIGIFLSVSFSTYGLVKSYLSTGAVISVAVENILLLPLIVIWLLCFGSFGAEFELSITQIGLLVLVGVITAIALILMSFATKNISFFAVGMLAFLSPILQAFNAVFFLDEPLSYWHKIALPIVLLGCAIYCFDLWKKSHRLS